MGRSFGERQLVELLRKQFGGQVGASESSAVRLGIGDDAAVLHRLAGDLVCSVDVNVEGVHFDRAWLSLQDIGYRSMQAALSDLAAMGAQPVAVLSAWILPRSWSREDSQALSDGQRQASLQSGCPVIGGNVSRGSELSITTTVLGQIHGSLLQREGAQPGDQLWLLGELGCAAAGLCALRSWSRSRPEKLAMAGTSECVESWRRPRALLAEGLQLAAAATAALDVSDGLAEDVRQLAEASAVRIVVDAPLLNRACSGALRRAGAALGVAPLHWALHGGEDYALLATGSARQRPAGARVIGRVQKGSGALLCRQGQLHRLSAGFDHLRG